MLPASHPRNLQPRLRADVFPANLKIIHDGQEAYIQKVRVIVTLTEIRVYQDAHGGPALIFKDGLADYVPPVPIHKIPAADRRSRGGSPGLTPTDAIATGDSGRVLQFSRSGSCGCGSRLRSFNPWEDTSSSGPASLAATSDR